MNRTSGGWVTKLIIINVGIFLLQGFMQKYQVQYMIGGLIPGQRPAMTYYLGLSPFLVAKGYVWQICSYMFLHGHFWHIFLNMYALLIFGIPIEQSWGSKNFLIYYFFTGIGAGLVIFLINFFSGGPGYYIPTIGASGAVFGILLAYGMLFPDSQILLFFVLPIKAKYLVVMYGAIELYSLISTGGGSGISHVGHLGGLLFGIFYFLFVRKRTAKFKLKKMRAEVKKKVEKRDVKTKIQKTDEKKNLVKILSKVKAGGFDSLSDDEVQLIRYLEIMSGEDNDLCVDQDFNPDDSYCEKCEHFEKCVLRELKKYR